MEQKKAGLTVIPDALSAFSFHREVLSGRHGRLMHKTLHSDLRDLDFVSSELCICFLLKGRERFFDTGGECTEIHAGEMVIIPPNLRLRSDFRCHEGPLEAMMIFLSPELVTEALGRLGSVPEIQPCHIEKVASDPRLEAFMQSVVQIYADLKVDAVLVHLKLMELLMLLAELHGRTNLSAALQSSTALQGRRSIAQVARVFQDQDLSIPELAALSGRSVATFNREFKRIFDASPAQWRKRQRLERAKTLLSDSDEAVTSIGLSIGYENTSHFIGDFKKSFGTTPGQFRKSRDAAE